MAHRAMEVEGRRQFSRPCDPRRHPKDAIPLRERACREYRRARLGERSNGRSSPAKGARPFLLALPPGLTVYLLYVDESDDTGVKGPEYLVLAGAALFEGKWRWGSRGAPLRPRHPDRRSTSHPGYSHPACAYVCALRLSDNHARILCARLIRASTVLWSSRFMIRAPALSTQPVPPPSSCSVASGFAACREWSTPRSPLQAEA